MNNAITVIVLGFMCGIPTIQIIKVFIKSNNVNKHDSYDDADALLARMQMDKGSEIRKQHTEYLEKMREP